MITYSNSLLRGSLILLALSVGSAAYADEVQITGSTLGQFNAQAYLPTNSILDLVFDNSTFDNATVGGQLDLGGNPNPGTNFNNLGSFTLGLTDNLYNGNTFTLQVTFSAPTTISGGSTAVFTDIITGTVSGGMGGVFIDFDNTPQVFSFANGTSEGSFTMFVNDTSIAPGQSASLTAHINGSQQPVPEPTSIVAFACGVIALCGRRLKNRK